MDISYYKQMEPFWGIWYIDEELGAGSFGRVFKVKREDFGRTYTSALKVISIPNDKNEIGSLKTEGMDDMSISKYYESFALEIVDEFTLMSKLRGHSNIVSYEDHLVRKHDDGIGYDIFIRMELLTPLNSYLQKNTISEENVIQLGIDICKALELCEQHKIIHRDIKPENIFISEHGTYKLGDFGVSRIAEGATQGMSVKGTVSYMAPEVYKGQPYNFTVDLYSLGIVLYKLSNNNRGPFLPPVPQPITHGDRDRAENLRMNGTFLPKAANASDSLMEIIRRAAAYDSRDRYASAHDMRVDLENVLNGGEILNVALTKEYTPKTTDESLEDNRTVVSSGAISTDAVTTQGKKKIFIAAGIIAALLLIAIPVVIFLGRGKNDDTETASISVQDEVVSLDTVNTEAVSTEPEGAETVSVEPAEQEDSVTIEEPEETVSYSLLNNDYWTVEDDVIVSFDAYGLFSSTCKEMTAYLDSMHIPYNKKLYVFDDDEKYVRIGKDKMFVYYNESDGSFKKITYRENFADKETALNRFIELEDCLPSEYRFHCDSDDMDFRGMSCGNYLYGYNKTVWGHFSWSGDTVFQEYIFHDGYYQSAGTNFMDYGGDVNDYYDESGILKDTTECNEFFTRRDGHLFINNFYDMAAMNVNLMMKYLESNDIPYRHDYNLTTEDLVIEHEDGVETIMRFEFSGKFSQCYEHYASLTPQDEAALYAELVEQASHYVSFDYSNDEESRVYLTKTIDNKEMIIGYYGVEKLESNYEGFTIAMGMMLYSEPRELQ